MTRDELLAALRELEGKLRSAKVQSHFAAQDEHTRRRFVAVRIELSRAIGELTNEQLATVERQLNHLDGDLRVGITGLQRVLDDLADTVAIFDAAGKILGLVGQVVPLV